MKKLTVPAILVVALIILALAALIYYAGQRQVPDAEDIRGVDLIGDRGTVKLSVEVAANDTARKTGLMNRTALEADAGMLFVFDNDKQRYFWMKDTLIPLDMVFIASDLTIIDVHENATPLSETPIASSGPCRYVLEVNGGLCDAAGIDVGDRVRLNG